VTEFTLTATEVACGVDLPSVERESCRALLTRDGDFAVLDPKISPALAGAAARMKLGGPVRFLYFNFARMPVYARE